MNNKKSLLDQIAAKIKRKKDLREEIATRNSNVEAFVLKMITEIEEMMATTVNTSLIASLVPLYVSSLEERIKALDSGCSVDIQLVNNEGCVPRVNGILIKWSKEYQTKNNCEEQLFVDVTSLLFK